MKELFKTIVVHILRTEAQLVLQKYQPRIVAVTGSVGKTTTKDAVYAVLESTFHVRKSEKSFNSEIGVPLTILGCENGWNNPIKWLQNIWEGFLLIVMKNHYPKWLVLEVGADRPGDIKSIAAWLEPDTAILTRLPDMPVHVEFFDSPEAVAQEKWALAESLSDDGVLIINYDDDRLRGRKSYARHLTFTYGFADGADFQALHMQTVYEQGTPVGMTFRVEYKGNSVPVVVHGALGKQHVYPILAAIATGVSKGMNLVSAGQVFEHYTSPPGRMRLIPGMNGTTIIDDTYNSSPAALQEALDTLKGIETSGRKIAVVGDMLELGTYTATAHRNAGDYTKGRADILIAVGVRARQIAERAREAGMAKTKVLTYHDSSEATLEIPHMLKEGDVLLVKGSQSMRMERITKACMQNPDDAPSLLVRQEAEWKNR